MLKWKLCAFLFFVGVLQAVRSQNVAINNDGSLPHSSAMLDIKSSAGGLLIPRMAMSDRNAISSPAIGLLIFQTDVVPGFYYYDGASWVNLSLAASSWNLNGNSGINASNNFIGTTDFNPLNFRVNNLYAGQIHPSGNIFLGLKAGQSNTNGHSNVAIGGGALFSNTVRSNLVAIGDSALYNDGTIPSFPDFGNYNTAVGSRSLFSNTIGYSNTAIGYYSLLSNTQGFQNTAIGTGAMFLSTTGTDNTSAGFNALFSNTTGSANTSVGSMSLLSNTTGYSNIAIGNATMQSNGIGQSNTAIGTRALFNNYSGSRNIAIGDSALYTGTTGRNTAVGFQALFNSQVSNNSAFGYQAMFSNTTGDLNTGVGYQALLGNMDGQANTASGYKALSSNVSGGNNTAFGAQALLLTTGSQNTAIGSDALSRNVSGNNNCAMGSSAAYANNADDNTVIGANAMSSASSPFANANTVIGSQALLKNQTGSTNVAVGFHSLDNSTSGYTNVAVGNFALTNITTGEGNIGIGYNPGACNLGAGSIFNSIVIGSDPSLCTLNSNYALFGTAHTVWTGGNTAWSIYSDARIKTNIQEDVVGLPFIMKLRPVTYNRSVKAFYDATGTEDKMKDYPGKYDIEKIRMTGFLAQEVEQAANEVGYNFDGVTKPKSDHDLYSLSYATFVVPLVKAMQEQQAIIDQQQKQIIDLVKRIEALEKK